MLPRDACVCACGAPVQVLSFAPDVLLLCPCSRSPEAAMPDVARLTQLPGFNNLPAVTSGRVYVIDHGYFSRPGPRLVDGVEVLCWLLWGVAQPPSVNSQPAVLKIKLSPNGDVQRVPL